MMMKAVSRDLVRKLWRRQEERHFTSGAETKLGTKVSPQRSYVQL